MINFLVREKERKREREREREIVETYFLKTSFVGKDIKRTHIFYGVK